MFLGILRFYLCKKKYMFIRQNLSISHSREVCLFIFSSKLRLAKCNLLIIIFTKHIFFYINRISRSQGTFWYFFLSDCGPSNEVANTLYRGGNKNLCVCPAQLPSWSRPGGGGGGGANSSKGDIQKHICIWKIENCHNLISISPSWGDTVKIFKIHFSDLNTLPDHMVVVVLHLKNLMHPTVQ